MGRMKYVQRRANRFEFRYPLPDDLSGKAIPQPWPDALRALINPRTGRIKTELIRSLQTSDRPEAERRALAYIAETHALVEQTRRVLRDGPPAGIAPEQIAAIIRDHEIDLLQRDERLREPASPFHRT